MSQFVQRRRGESTTPVAIDRRAAALIPEALDHVASSVFESEQDERNHLRDAAEAVRRALVAGVIGATVEVRLTDKEGEHVPEALAHVGHEVFKGQRKGDLLWAASRAVSEAFPKAPGFGR